jgi:hypothetical protein
MGIAPMTGLSNRAGRRYPQLIFGGVKLMKLNAPKNITFWAAVILAAVGVVSYVFHHLFVDIPNLGGIGFFLLFVAFVLICLGLLVKGM